MTTKLMEALAAITESDYSALVQQIDEHEKKLASMKELLRIVCGKLGKPDPTAKKTWSRKPKDTAASASASEPAEAPDQEELNEALRPPAGTTKTEHYRTVVKRYIQANGPKPLHEIRKATGIPEGSIGGVIKHPMFVNTALGYGLTANHK